MIRFPFFTAGSVALFGAVSSATAMNFDDLFSAPDSPKTELLCRGYATNTPVDGQICGTDFAPLQRKAIADICFRPREDSAQQALARLQNTEPFWKDFTKATEFALSQGFDHGQLFAMPMAEPLYDSTPDTLRLFMQQNGLAPSVTAFSGFQEADTPDAAFAATQPLVREGFAYPFPNQLPVAFTDFKFPSGNVMNTYNVVPASFARQPLCGEEDYNENGEIRAAGDPRPLLNSELPSVVAILDKEKKIGSGVLIARNLVLTAAHVLNGEEKRIGTGLVTTRNARLEIVGTKQVGGVDANGRTLDLAVILLDGLVTDEEAGATPIVELLPSNDLNDTESITAGYGNRSNEEIEDGFTGGVLASQISDPLPDDLSDIRRTSRVMRIDRCTDEAEHIECKFRAELFRYEAMLQDGAKMPFTSCAGDSGSPVFVQTEGPTGQLVVSAIFSIAGGQLQTGSCAQQMYFTDVTAKATQDAIRETVKQLDPNFDTESLFVSGKLRRFGRILDLASSNG